MLDKLWQTVLEQADDDWYIYALSETPPLAPSNNDDLNHFLKKRTKLLKQDHEQEYCGIVYSDSLETPSYIKIFDPNNLGVVCGFSDNPPLPGWIISKLTPIDLSDGLPAPLNRRRWWARLFRRGHSESITS